MTFNRVTTPGGSRARGFGVGFEWGTTGTSYGDPRQNKFFTVVIALWWQWELSWHWRA